MSTNLGVFKIPIPAEYKKIDRYEYANINYDDEYLVYTLDGFDSVNIITELFDITYNKSMTGSDGLFDACYVIKYEDFLKAKTIYFDDYNCNINSIMEKCGIKKEDYSYISEGLKDFFNNIETVFQDEKELFFDIG